MANRVRAGVPDIDAELGVEFYHQACVREVERPQFLMLDVDDLDYPQEIEVRFDVRSHPVYEMTGRRHDDE